MPKIIKEECAGCGVCIPACPVHAISLAENIAVIDKSICTNCNACISACPQETIIPDLERSGITSPPATKKDMGTGRGMGPGGGMGLGRRRRGGRMRKGFGRGIGRRR